MFHEPIYTTTKLLHFDASLNDLDLHSRSWFYEKVKTFCTLISEFSMRLNEMKFAVVNVHELKLAPILCRMINI